jgi:hypothetical protein
VLLLQSSLAYFRIIEATENQGSNGKSSLAYFRIIVHCLLEQLCRICRGKPFDYPGFGNLKISN